MNEVGNANHLNVFHPTNGENYGIKQFAQTSNNSKIIQKVNQMKCSKINHDGIKQENTGNLLFH